MSSFPPNLPMSRSRPPARPSPSGRAPMMRKSPQHSSSATGSAARPESHAASPAACAVRLGRTRMAGDSSPTKNSTDS